MSAHPALVKAANALYRSDQAHFYEVSWTNTMIGSPMRQAFRSYDNLTANRAAINLANELRQRHNYYQANPNITYLGIMSIWGYDGMSKAIAPPFDCYQ